MDFLLECIGFDPMTEPEELHRRIRAEGEPVAWRGPGGEHLRLDVAPNVELRLDREEDEELVTLLPYYAERTRLRIAASDVRVIADSPFDALLTGWVAPPAPGLPVPWSAPGAYLLATWLTDARRLPQGMQRGHVLAVSAAGFALDVTFVGPNDQAPRPELQQNPRGAWIQPLGGPEDPGGCSELSARIEEVRHTTNRLTGRPIDIVTVDAPERRLSLFVSPWQLAQDGLPQPRPGYRIEGTFLFTGRIAGGLPRPRRAARRNFG